MRSHVIVSRSSHSILSALTGTIPKWRQCNIFRDGSGNCNHRCVATILEYIWMYRGSTGSVNARSPHPCLSSVPVTLSFPIIASAAADFARHAVPHFPARPHRHHHL